MAVGGHAVAVCGRCSTALMVPAGTEPLFAEPADPDGDTPTVCGQRRRAQLAVSLLAARQAGDPALWEAARNRALVTPVDAVTGVTDLAAVLAYMASDPDGAGSAGLLQVIARDVAAP
jgi:hypothetical protein